MTLVLNGTTGVSSVDGSASTPAIQGTDSNTGIFFPAADTVAIATGGSERLRADSSGNVGIGVTPNAWNSVFKAVQIQVGAFVASQTNANDIIHIGTNAFLNSSGDWKYINTAAATRYQQYLGAHTWYTAASGTAGNTISFTQAMTLDSSGNLLVNTTSADARFVVVDAATSGWGARILKSSGSGTPQGLQVVVGQNSSNEVFQCAQGTSFGSITNLFKVNGNGLINTATASSSPYNNTTGSAANMVVTSAGDLQRSTSSLKYKTDINDATHGLAEVMLLRPVTYKGKNDGDIVFGGLIAEEVHAAGLTEFVQYAEDGSPDALAYGNMVSLCIKAIQELKAELDTAKARIAALEAA